MNLRGIIQRINRPYLKRIDLKKRILEIGPLNNPMIEKSKTDGGRVFYADIRSTEELKVHYNNRYKNICNIDYVIKDSYAESLKDVEKFDYIIASHVLEHIPQLILFFQDIAKILKPGGQLYLIIPDKRFCFDRFRNPISFAECYDIYRRNINNSPVRILDCFMNYSINDPVYWWFRQSRFELISENKELFETAKKRYEKAINNGTIDFSVHYSVFTPESFLILLYNITSFSLFPFVCKNFNGTRIFRQEFNCVLEVDFDLLLSDSVKINEQKLTIVKFLNKNPDSSIYSLKKTILRLLLFIPYIFYRKLIRLVKK